MNQNPQSSDGRNDDDSALSDFLASLMDYTPTVCNLLSLHLPLFLFYLAFLLPYVTIFNQPPLFIQIPDELVEHYLAKSGFQCPDVRLWVLLFFIIHYKSVFLFFIFYFRTIVFLFHNCYQLLQKIGTLELNFCLFIFLRTICFHSLIAGTTLCLCCLFGDTAFC